MLHDLTPPQRELADFMSDLSEEAYCAGWMIGWEYTLWEALLRTEESLGRLSLTDEERARLRQLSEACGGWIVFDDRNEETWVPLAEWERLFSTRRS